MNHPTFDFSAFVDAGRKAIAPAIRFNEISMQGFERMARQQYAFAGDLLEYSLKQLELAGTARDLNDLAARQVELSTQFAERATQRSQDLLKLTSEQQAQFTKWFDQAVAESTHSVSESAKSAKKAA